MGWVAGAAAAVSAVAGVVSSSNAAGAAKSAANTQAAAADRASAAAQQEQAQTRADLAPYNTSGQAAQTSLDGLASGDPSAWAKYGMSGPTFQPTQASLEATPGYQWNLAQGLKSVASSNAAKGLGVSGAALKGAAQYATGLANNTLTTQAGIFQNNYNNVLNPLTANANRGEAAASMTGQLGTQGTANSNALMVGGANAQASGQIGSANALSGGINGIGNAAQGGASSYMLMNYLNGNGGSSSYSGPSGVSPAVDQALIRAGGYNA
jgi:hypothetical protein